MHLTLNFLNSILISNIEIIPNMLKEKKKKEKKKEKKNEKVTIIERERMIWISNFMSSYSVAS
jgi:hypothetical protein